MDSATDGLEAFWENLLSSDRERIRRAWRTLSPAEAAGVRAHLQDMAHGLGWQPAQRQAAADALRVLATLAQE